MVAQDFEAVLKGKYPAKDHAKRVTELIREKVPDANGLIYLEATPTIMQEDNDSPVPFRYVAGNLPSGDTAARARLGAP